MEVRNVLLKFLILTIIPNRTILYLLSYLGLLLLKENNMNTKQQIELIDEAMCRINSLYSEWAREHGISYNKMMTLYALNRNKKCTQKQICDEWLIPKQTVNIIIKNMKENGYIVFERGKSNSKVIKLTEKGERYVESKIKDLHIIEEEAMKRLGVEISSKFVEIMMNYERTFTEVMKNE